MENNWQCDNDVTTPGSTCTLTLEGATDDFITGTYIVTFGLTSIDGWIDYFMDLESS